MTPNHIHLRTEIIIEDEKIEEHKKLVLDMSNLVEATEPGTINYEFYFDRGETRCIGYQTYANSGAVFVHTKGVASRTILSDFQDL